MKMTNKKVYVGFETVEDGTRMVQFPDCPGCIVVSLDDETMKKENISSFEELVRVVFIGWYETMVASNLKINNPSSCLDMPDGAVKIHVVEV